MHQSVSFTHAPVAGAHHIQPQSADGGGAAGQQACDAPGVFPVDPWLKAGGKEENLVGCRKENGYVTLNVQALLGKLRRDCEAVRARHATATVERFAVNGDYRAMVGEMLDTGAAAVCSLRWYLEDSNLSCAELLYTSLITGHKRYLGYLARTRAWCGNALCYSLCGDT